MKAGPFSSVHDLARRLVQFRRDSSGNVAIIFALALVPLIGFVGAGVDYSVANKIRTKLLAAADAASISAIAKASSGMTSAASMTGDGPVTSGSGDAVKFFKAEIQSDGGYTLDSVTAEVTKTGSTVTATVKFAASVPTSLVGLLGFSSIPIGGTASAANNLPVFIDFHLLLDNTPSMGVGATPADVATMVANTSDKCAFACHDKSDSNNYYKLAKKLGVTMRIDVLRTATQQLMDTAAQTAAFSNQFRMAIYTFGAKAEATGLTTISALTSNLSSAKAQANAIDLMTIPYQNYNSDQQTDFDSVLTAVNKAITTPGTGTSSASPQKVLFFVSDGVADAYNPSGCSQKTTSGGRCQEPIDTSFCKTIKDRGIKIAVLYTTYLPLPTNSWYQTWIAPFAGKIGSTMEACASPGFYFEVSPTDGISQAMSALFQKAVAQARLTK